MDLILLFDVLHAPVRPAHQLREMSRVLKDNGVMAVYNEHMSERSTVALVRQAGFELCKPGNNQNESVLTFRRAARP